jgi:O-antigen/teichoic acid export membrane protein
MANQEQQIKNTFIYLLPVIVGNVLPFVTIPIFTRILTKEDYGVLALALVYAVFINGLVNFGMAAAYDRNYFQYRDDRLRTAQLLYSLLLFVTLNFLLVAALTFVFRATLSELIIGSVKHGNVLFLASCAQFFSTVNYYYLAFFRNSEKAKDYTLSTIVNGMTNFIISLVLVAYLRIGVTGILYAQLFSGAMVFGILTYRFRSFLPVSFDKKVFSESLRIAYPLTPRIFLGVISTQFDKYMIGLLASVGQTGIYSIGQRVSSIVFTCMTAMQNVFSPQVYRKMFDVGQKGSEPIGRYLTPFVYVSIFFALFLSLFSEEIISIMTPPSYHGAIDIVIILSMYYGFLFFGKVIGTQLIFTKKTHITSLLTMVSICINVGLNIPFVIKWGAVGAAWGAFLAGLISGTFFFFIAQYYYEIKWEYTKIGSIFLTFFGSAILMILLRDAGVTYYIRVAIKLMSVCVYFYTGVKAGIITIENLTLVKNILVGSSLQTAKRKTTY